jgi:hypothetical protein
MKRTIVLPSLVIAFVALTPTTVAFATPSPNGPGQPGVEIGENGVTGSAPGFQTGGFANAETRYAGSQPQNSRNTHSVSQYDVAGYQLTPGVHKHCVGACG